MTKVSTNLGKVATTPKGEYNALTTYTRLDIVSYNGSSYVALQESTGNLPTNTTYWQLLASKGDPGAEGHTPVKGVDYFTQEDIASLNIPDDTSDLTNGAGYITNEVNDLTNYYKKNETYNQTEIDTKLSAVYKYKGTVSTYNDLPSFNLTIGDVYNIEQADSTHGIKAGDNVAWNGTVWDVLAGTIDLSNYVTNTDYPTTSSSGVIKLSNVYFTSITESGSLRTGSATYQQYLDANNGAFVGKGTLENVIAGKGIIDSTKVKTTTSTTSGDVYDVTYINGLIGDINTILATLTTPSSDVSL